MILFFSSDGRSFGDASVIYGDEASVMLTYWHTHSRKDKDGTGSSFARLARARRRGRQGYKAYRDFHVKREIEREYVISMPLSGGQIKSTSLLFSLLRDFVPDRKRKEPHFIYEISNGVRRMLYAWSWKHEKWVWVPKERIFM